MEREARERVSRVEAESTATLASAHEGTKSLVQKVALLKGELAEVCWAHEVDEETFHGLSNIVADAEWRQEEFEGGTGSSWRSSPSCSPRAPSCALPLSVLRG
jgi:hypothetical protein